MARRVQPPTSQTSRPATQIEKAPTLVRTIHGAGKAPRPYVGTAVLSSIPRKEVETVSYSSDTSMSEDDLVSIVEPPSKKRKADPTKPKKTRPVSTPPPRTFVQIEGIIEPEVMVKVCQSVREFFKQRELVDQEQEDMDFNILHIEGSRVRLAMTKEELADKRRAYRAIHEATDEYKTARKLRELDPKYIAAKEKRAKEPKTKEQRIKSQLWTQEAVSRMKKEDPLLFKKHKEATKQIALEKAEKKIALKKAKALEDFYPKNK